VKGGGFDAKEGLSAAAIMRAVDESLNRLRTDYIDLYFAHIDDMDTPLEETLEAFDRLVKAGKVRALGCSNHYTYRLERARMIAQARGWTPYSCIQQRYTYLRPKPGADFGVQISVSDEMLQYIAAHDDVTLMAYSPLLNGAYSRDDRQLPPQYAGADANARLGVLKEIAQEIGATNNQVILAWMLQRRQPVVPLIAASTTEQLQENLDALGVILGPEHIERLNAAGEAEAT
jgi:aryl-alcohol dehydrogenase-like predicted oxidoreductase